MSWLCTLVVGKVPYSIQACFKWIRKLDSVNDQVCGYCLNAGSTAILSGQVAYLQGVHPTKEGTNKWVGVLGCKADNLPRLSTREAPVVKRVGWLPTSVAVLDRAVAIGKVDDGIGQGTVRVGHGRLSTFGSIISLAW